MDRLTVGGPGGGVTAAWPCKYMIFITTLSLGACTSGAKLMWANKRLAVRFTPLLMRTIMSVPHTTTGSNGWVRAGNKGVGERERGGGRFLTHSASSAIISELIASDVYAAPFKGRRACFFFFRSQAQAEQPCTLGYEEKYAATTEEKQVVLKMCLMIILKKVVFNLKKKKRATQVLFRINTIYSLKKKILKLNPEKILSILNSE